MSKGGSRRDWGYASYDMDNPDSDNLIYTSYEKNGSVNQYPQNDDGGHGHYHWDDKNDHDLGRNSNYGRSESNSSENPSIGEVQNNGGCYLTSACMQHFAQQFNDKCYELQLLRWFRDKWVSEEDIAHYYETAPLIVNEINTLPNCNEIYDEIYYHVIAVCVKAIEKNDYAVAYQRYKESILQLEETYVRPALEQRLIRALQQHNA